MSRVKFININHLFLALLTSRFEHYRTGLRMSYSVWSASGQRRVDQLMMLKWRCQRSATATRQNVHRLSRGCQSERARSQSPLCCLKYHDMFTHQRPPVRLYYGIKYAYVANNDKHDWQFVGLLCSTADLITCRLYWVFARDSIYAIARICYRPSVCLFVRVSVCLSHGWFSQKRLKLGSCDFHHQVAPWL